MKVIHIHLTTRKTGDAIRIMSEADIMRKIRAGEWEAVQDIVKGKMCELRNSTKKNFTVRVKDAEYSAYHQAMEATKAAQALLDKACTPSSSRKPDALFREASQACKKAASLWAKAAQEDPVNKSKFIAAESKWNGEAQEMGRRSAGDSAPTEKIEREIAVQQKLIDSCTRNGRAVPPVLQQRLAFLKEELEKAKVRE